MTGTAGRGTPAGGGAGPGERGPGDRRARIAGAGGGDVDGAVTAHCQPAVLASAAATSGVPSREQGAGGARGAAPPSAGRGWPRGWPPGIPIGAFSAGLI